MVSSELQMRKVQNVNVLLESNFIDVSGFKDLLLEKINVKYLVTLERVLFEKRGSLLICSLLLNQKRNSE